MPVSPAMAEDLARAVAVLYEEAELALLDRLRVALAAGIDSPRWVELKLAAVGNLASAVQEIIAALAYDATGAIGSAVAEAYERGQQAAVAELDAVGVGQAAAAARAVPAAAAVDRLAAAVVADTGPVHLRMLRVTVDAYRDVIARVSATPLTGAVTRRQAAQRALDQFAGRGIHGFVDKAGRSWDMASYAEMATRSVVGRAAVQAHTDRLTANGRDLVTVSDSPEECPLCRKWEGKILTLSGPGGARTIEVEHATEDGRMMRVRVSGSLEEARSSGLMHPNCRLPPLREHVPAGGVPPSAPPRGPGGLRDDAEAALLRAADPGVEAQAGCGDGRGRPQARRRPRPGVPGQDPRADRRHGPATQEPPRAVRFRPLAVLSDLQVVAVQRPVLT